MKIIVTAFTLLFSILAYGQILKPRVIYNTDTRQEILSESPAEIMHFIQKRTLAVVHSANLFTQPTGQILIMPKHYGRAFKLCENERFYNQPSLARCTASIIGKNLILTAGHCISEDNCRFTRFIADFVLEADGSNPIRTSADKIFSCKNIIYENDSPELDMAIVQIDRDFSESPLMLAEQQLTTLDEILAVGFPSGLPMKSSGLGPIRKVSSNKINAELETYGGNSGSPIFKKNSSLVEGILVAGEDDFVLSEKENCYRSNVCTSSTCIGEDIISAQAIRSILTGLRTF